MNKLTVEQRIEASKRYLGDGTYEALDPVISAKAYSEGWKYVYPQGIVYNGKPYRELYHTLDSLEFLGVITLELKSRTQV